MSKGFKYVPLLTLKTFNTRLKFYWAILIVSCDTYLPFLDFLSLQQVCRYTTTNNNNNQQYNTCMERSNNSAHYLYLLYFSLIPTLFLISLPVLILAHLPSCMHSFFNRIQEEKLNYLCFCFSLTSTECLDSLCAGIERSARTLGGCGGKLLNIYLTSIWTW